MTSAIKEYIRTVLPDGGDFIDSEGSASFSDILCSAVNDSANTTPIFFILSPGYNNHLNSLPILLNVYRLFLLHHTFRC